MNAVADDVSPTVLRNEPLARHTSWRVGGPAEPEFAPGSDGAALLISVPPDRKLTDVTAALVKAGASVRSSALVGSHATRYTVPASSARAQAKR